MVSLFCVLGFMYLVASWHQFDSFLVSRLQFHGFNLMVSLCRVFGFMYLLAPWLYIDVFLVSRLRFHVPPCSVASM
eukprot:TRINITY_DN3050_c1_g1_i7.p1 TRINITY_DN3050_c1_g1~~TRINITY_DN3050_c1_g1_i7.p1  ORF type:complete len:76 (-),score=6.93 TRINITY_DN3050_c1_g1_i7:124-351(-)